MPSQSPSTYPDTFEWLHGSLGGSGGGEDSVECLVGVVVNDPFSIVGLPLLLVVPGISSRRPKVGAGFCCNPRWSYGR